LTVFSSIVVAIVVAGASLTVVRAGVRAGFGGHIGLQRAVRGVPHHDHRSDMGCSGAPTVRSALSTRGPDPGDLTGTPE